MKNKLYLSIIKYMDQKKFYKLKIINVTHQKLVLEK